MVEPTKCAFIDAARARLLPRPMLTECESRSRARARAYILYKLCDYICSVVLPLNAVPNQLRLRVHKRPIPADTSLHETFGEIFAVPLQRHTPNKSLVLGYLSQPLMLLALLIPGPRCLSIFCSFVALFAEFICAKRCERAHAAVDSPNNASNYMRNPPFKLS